MSKESSYKAYTRSSFDAIETTRRLSDDLADRDKICQEHHANFHVNEENTHATETLNISRNENVCSTSINGALFSSSALISVAKKSSPDSIGDNENRATPVKQNGTNYDHEDDKDEENKVDQRSESDSDLESPDDFDENTYGNLKQCDRTDLLSHTEKGDMRNYEENKNNPDISESNGYEHVDNPASNLNTNKSYQTTFKASYIESASELEDNKNGIHMQQDPSVRVDGESDILENNNISLAEGAEKSESNEESIALENMCSYKVHDDDVLNQSEKLDAVKDIRVETLTRLQHLDKNDPSLRRLFMRPRVSPNEVMSLKVDPDIKSMVNEFLKTNVTENFIIARVLRENYATFYSWLASHIQTERNAWAARMGQALDNAERERKGSLEGRNLVVEAAIRLRTLARTMCNSLTDSALYKEDDSRALLRKGPSLRHGAVKGFEQSDCLATLSTHCTERSHDPHISSLQHQNNTVEMIKKSDDGTSSVLRQSSFNIIEVSELVSYESDPGTGRTANADWKKNHVASKSMRNKTTSFPKQVGDINDRKKLPNNKNILTSNTVVTGRKACQDGKDPESLHYGYTVNGVVVDFEDETDWKQVLTDSIEILTEACDAFLTDKKACFQLLSGKTSQCGRLVDVLAAYIQDNQAKDYLKRKEIEKRLEILERENRAMQEEMSVLRKMLLDESEDAMVLRTHLNHIESVVKCKKQVEKVDKCVGTNENSSKKFLKSLGTIKGGKNTKAKSSYIMSVEGMGKDEGSKNKGDIHKIPNTNEGYKLSKSPNLTKEPKTTTETKQSVATSNSSEKLESGERNLGMNDPVRLPQTALEQKERGGQNSTQLTLVRQPSFIEISEEKLEKLKHRAKKLENSLHEAINSMDTLNKSAHWLERVRVRANERPGPALHIQKVNEAGNQTAKNIAYWRKSGLEVSNTLSFNGTRPIVCSKNALSFETPRTAKNITPAELSTTLHSEHSSLLQGKSILMTSLSAESGISIRDKKSMDNISSLKLVPDRSQGLTPRSVASRGDGYHSDDEDRRSYYHNHQDLSARSEISHKVRARRGQVKQLVSKCLRCQKLFSTTDNHKLACCYHTKNTERLEHYDHMGMLVKVIHAWKCCNQPQEAEGCCFGKHV